tara:strand:- start:431 stop:997 length:567 start_codon:yes stop_codon:yes gene_type:complete
MKIIVLLSGGEDSIVLAEMAHRRNSLAGLLFFDYKQPAKNQEFNAAGNWSKSKGYTLTVKQIPIVGVSEHMKIGTGLIGPRILPGRNLVFISHAINMARGIGANVVWYGANSNDHDYVDCSPEFVKIVDAIGRFHGVRVEAPLLKMSKKEIHKYAENKSIDLTLSWSCYEPTEDGSPCGTCNSCRLKA